VYNNYGGLSISAAARKAESHMITCLSPNGQNLDRLSAPATRLLVATLTGIDVLERTGLGAPWVKRGKKLDGQHCSSLTREPKRGGIFAGMHSGGLFFSGDGGETWERRTNGITIDHVYCVGYAHQHDGGVTMYAGTEPASMFRSDDYGLSWVSNRASRRPRAATNGPSPARRSRRT
jgi:photosystem II stability/assembly factor-like uncharacterized protein